MESHEVDLKKFNSVIDPSWFSECRVCHSKNSIGVENTIMYLQEYKGGIPGGQDMSVIPFIALTCNRCGNIILLNALTLGLMPPEEMQNVRENTPI